MADFAELQQEIKGRILTSSDGNLYENQVHQCWNAAHRKIRPLAFVKVKTQEDVENTVKFCATNELEICVSAGGTSGFCRKDNAVVIDLSWLCRVRIDTVSEVKTAIIDGGVKVSDVYQILHSNGVGLPLASFTQLSVTGMALIGGGGFLSRNYGVLSDSVLEYDIVLPSGESIKASADENSELFWGMKGHGANFGITTSIKFKLHPLPSVVVGGSMYFKFSQAESVIKMVRDYCSQENDDCLSVYMLIHVTSSRPELIVRLLYSGTIRRGGEVAQDLADLTHPYRFVCGPTEIPDFHKQGDVLLPSGRYDFGVAGHIVGELKDELIGNILSCLKDVEDYHYLSGTIIYISENLGGKDAQVSYEESSFPFRQNARFWIGLNASTKNEEDYDKVKKWSNHFQEVTGGHDTPPYDGGDQEAIMSKLKKLKKQYDPSNMFHNNLAPIDV